MKVTLPKEVHDMSPEGTLIKAFRLRADVPQHELSMLMGYSTSMISQVEGGFIRASVQLIKRFSRTLGLSLAEEQQLLTLRGQPFRVRSSKVVPTFPAIQFLEPGDSDE